MHQLSGVFVLAGAGSLILFHDRSSMPSKAILLAAIALGSIATLAWPYFQILEIVSSASDPGWKSAVDAINDVSTMALLAAPTLLGVLGFRKPAGGVRWELLFPAATFTIGYVFLTLQDSPIAHRILPAVILYCQLGIVWLVLGYARRPNLSPAIRVVLASAALLVVAASGLRASMMRIEALKFHAAEQSLLATAEAIAARLPPGSVSFSTERIVFPLQATGWQVVSIPRPEPAAPSLGARQLATDQFFNVSTDSNERHRLIAQWGATHAVFVAEDLDPRVIDEVRKLGPSKTFAHDVEVVSFAGTEPSALRGGPNGG